MAPEDAFDHKEHTSLLRLESVVKELHVSAQGTILSVPSSLSRLGRGLEAMIYSGVIDSSYYYYRCPGDFLFSISYCLLISLLAMTSGGVVESGEDAMNDTVVL